MRSAMITTENNKLLARTLPSPLANQKLKQFRTLSLLFLPLIVIFISGYVSCVVVYQVRFIATKNGRTDYALAGESIELSCHYIMKDEAEDVKQLVWSKDGKNFLRWRKHKPGLEVLSYTFKGHVDPSSKHSHITIHNVTIGMHGKYKCSVKTDLGIHEMEQDLVVISQTNCKLNDWRVTSQPSECRESFKFDCKNMFPKPVTSCGLWNGKLEKFIRSVTVDISEEPNKQTYRIRYADKFELKNPDGSVNSIHSDLLQYAGHLVFKCDIIVPETSWKLNLIHRMFDYDDGCLQDPLETIERMRMNYSHYATTRMQQAGYLVDRQLDDFEMLASSLEYEFIPSIRPNGTRSEKLDLNCWQKPRHGILAKLSCVNKGDQTKLTGASMLECRPSGWVPIVGPTDQSKPLVKKLSPRNRRPLPQQRSSRRITNNSAETGDGGVVGIQSHPELERVNLDDDNTATVVHISQDNPNDLEESDTISTTIDTTTILSTEVEFIPTTTTPYTTEDSMKRPINHQRPHQPDQLPELTPIQLVSLLPSCISTRRHVQSTMISNRLPLLDEDSRVRASNAPVGKRLPSPSDKDRSLLSFNFSPSSGTEGNRMPPTMQLLAFNFLITIILCPILSGMQVH